MLTSTNIKHELTLNGFCHVPQQDFMLSGDLSEALAAFPEAYHHMPEDIHLNPGEGERFRRYARFAIDPRTLTLSIFPHDRFFQSKTYDVLYGDTHRSFPPMTPDLIDNRFFQSLLRHNFTLFPQINVDEPYEISVHMIRIAATPGGQRGRPAPEGIHQDGYHFATIHLMKRYNLSGAENRIYTLAKEVIFRTHLLKPLDSIYLDDRKVFHGVEPFAALSEEETSYRDMLILLYQPLSQSPQPIAASTQVYITET